MTMRNMPNYAKKNDIPGMLAMNKEIRTKCISGNSLHPAECESREFISNLHMYIELKKSDAALEIIRHYEIDLKTRLQSYRQIKLETESKIALACNIFQSSSCLKTYAKSAYFNSIDDHYKIGFSDPFWSPDNYIRFLNENKPKNYEKDIKDTQKYKAEILPILESELGKLRDPDVNAPIADFIRYRAKRKKLANHAEEAVRYFGLDPEYEMAFKDIANREKLEQDQWERIAKTEKPDPSTNKDLEAGIRTLIDTYSRSKASR